jgi:hypothetical protein
MRNKKTIVIICAVFVAAGIFLAAGKVFSDNAGTPFSSKLASSIGAWYDETWQATGFYRLEQGGGVGNFVYKYTTTPTTTSAPVFISPDESVAIPQDMAVTEWKVSGHVHFASGI